MLPLLLAASKSASRLHRRPTIHNFDHSFINSNVTLFESNEICKKPDNLVKNIFKAIDEGDLISFRFLICLNPSEEINRFDNFFYFQPLAYSIQKNRFGMAMELMNKYSKYLDLDSQNKNGNTALHWGYIRGHNAVVCKLLELGANPKVYNVDGNIPEEVSGGWRPKCE